MRETLTLLSLGVLALYATGAIRQSLAALRARRWLLLPRTPPDPGATPPWMVILLPALREQSIARETFEYFKNLPYARDRLAIVFVTTQKEEHQRERSQAAVYRAIEELAGGDLTALDRLADGLMPSSAVVAIRRMVAQQCTPQELRRRARDLWHGHPTTAAMLDQLLQAHDGAGHRTLHRLHYPSTTGGKPSQLNYAIERLPELIPGLDPAQTIIGIYDFDSRPDRRTLRFIAADCAQRSARGQPQAQMYQQIQMPLRLSTSDVPGRLERAFMAGNAVWYLRHALGIELQRLRFRERLHAKHPGPISGALLRPVVYGAGAGMFLRMQQLIDLGLFPEPQEDLAIGYRLSMLGADIVPLPYINSVQAFSSYRQMIRSFALAFENSWAVLDARRQTRHLEPTRRLTTLEQHAIVVKECLVCVGWLLGAPATLAAFVWLLVGASGLIRGGVLLGAIGFLVKYPMDTSLLHAFTARLQATMVGPACSVVRPGPKTTALLAASAPVHGLMNAAPPWLGLARMGLAWLRGAPLERTKTER